MHIIGHKKQIEQLNRMLDRDMVPNAIMFTGAPHLGKYALAKKLANAVIKNEQNLLSLSNHTHSSCIYIEPPLDTVKGITRKKAIDIDMIRKAQAKMALTPGGGRKQVLLIDGVEMMTAQAQNALLKTLEEPNTDTLILLLTSNKESLLETIVSRCEILMFYDVTFEELQKYAKSKEEDMDLVKLAMGRPGLLIRMLEDSSEIEKRKQGQDMLHTLKNASIPEKLCLAEALAKNISDTMDMFELWINLLRYQTRNDAHKIRENYYAIQVLMRGLEVMRSTNTNNRLLLENIILAL